MTTPGKSHKYDTKNQIPHEPLTSLLEAWCEHQLDGRNASERTERVSLNPASTLQVQRVRTAIRRARTRGHIDLFVADDLSIGVLGLHPSEVYGLEWFDFGQVEANAEKVA